MILKKNFHSEGIVVPADLALPRFVSGHNMNFGMRRLFGVPICTSRKLSCHRNKDRIEENNNGRRHILHRLLLLFLQAVIMKTCDCHDMWSAPKCAVI